MESGSKSYSIESSSSSSSIVMGNERKGFTGIRLENPFTFKVFQVFTGFGFGCGVGIGVGHPLQLVVGEMDFGGLFKPKNGGENFQNSLPPGKPCSIPMLGEVMSAARGATSAFSGVTYHVNGALNKMGAKNVKAGIGCGVGLGHGFGIGLAVKPGVMQKVQASLLQLMMKMMEKFGMAPNLSIGQGAGPLSLQSGMGMMNQPSIQNPLGNITQLPTQLSNQTSQSFHGPSSVGLLSTSDKFTSKNYAEASFGRTEKVISSFLQSPMLSDNAAEPNAVGKSLQSENDMLKMLLKHQQVIEQLVEENEKLRHVLLEDLKISPSKLQSRNLSTNRYPCSDCFECRRRLRRK